MKDNFVFFYGGPLSQWYPSDFVVDNVKYCTAEQYMMAMKADYFDDKQAFNSIMSTTNPSKQKAIGRTVKGFDKEAWDAVSRGFVYKGNIEKFKQNPELKQYLLNTKDKELVEASPYDKIWGIGLDEGHPDRLDKSKWRGTNWLGEVLMKVRNDIKDSL